MTPKQYIEEREEEFEKFWDITTNNELDKTRNRGGIIKGHFKFHNTQTIKGLIEVIMEEIENTTQLAINGARKVIVDDYNEATRRYERAGMEIKEGEKYAVNDSLSENSKQVALSRLEPKVTKAINITLSDITTKLKTIIE